LHRRNLKKEKVMNNQELLIKNAVKRAFKEIDSTDGTDCPDEDALIQYSSGSLSEEQIEQLEKHLAGCDLCLDIVIEYQRLREVSAEELDIEVPEAITRRSIDLVPDKPLNVPSPFDVILQISAGVVSLLKKAADITPMMLDPMPVPIRGPEQADEGTSVQGAEMLSFSRELGRVTADVGVEGSAEGLLALNVKLSETATGELLDGLRVTLTDMEFELESARTRRGMVRFEDHEAGSYCLEILDEDSSEPGRITLKIENK